MNACSYRSFAGLLLCASPLAALAEDVWVSAQGRVQTLDGAPVCALVLANGQSLFSCDGAGTYDLDVPLDDQGRIRLMVFADGFAPFGVVTDSSGFPRELSLATAAPEQPTLRLSVGMQCSADGAQVRMQGQVVAAAATHEPVCALVLANGGQLFSCDAALGTYDLTVPLDAQGAVTLMAFAEGFQPYRASYRPCGDSNPPDQGVGGCWVSTDENYGGRTLYIPPGGVINRLDDTYYDEISSIAVAPGHHLEVSEQPDFQQGQDSDHYEIFRGEHPELAWEWDDDIAALWCRADDEAVRGDCVVYRHPNWEGGYLALYAGESLEDDEAWEDIYSFWTSSWGTLRFDNNDTKYPPNSRVKFEYHYVMQKISCK